MASRPIDGCGTEVVKAEREAHPQSHVRRKMLVLWLLHCGLTRAKTATVAGLGRATVQRHVAAYRDGGLDGLRQWDVTGPVSDLASFTYAIGASLTAAPVRTVAEACDRIEQLTGLRREPTQVRTFLKGLGFQWRRIGRPVPPKKTCPNHVREQREFLDGQLRPRLDAAAAGREHVFFVDAAHFVFGTFLCCLGRSRGCSCGRRPDDSVSTCWGRGTPSPGNWWRSPTRRW